MGIISLGCAKNLVDSEHMLAFLLQEGYTLTANPKLADILIVNTCAFISAAQQEAIDTILEMAEYKIKGRCQHLVVTGCLAQRYAKEIAQEMPEIDAIVGTGTLTQLPEILQKLTQGQRVVCVDQPGGLLEGVRLLTTPPGSAYLKIAEGCHHHCTYCIIPQLRGPLTSRPEENIVLEAQHLVDQGVKELTLIAQDTTSYGLDLYGEYRLPSLLRKLASVNNLHWLRLLYLYPEYITDDLLTVMAQEPTICHYLDIPIQHVSDHILKSMGRKSRHESLLRLMDKVRSVLPDATIRTTFIVGFPGETEADFQKLLDFVRKQQFDWVGAFVYSPQENTPAYGFANQVPDKIKQERLQQLLQEQQSITKLRNEAWVGKTLSVLIEKTTPQSAIGRCFRQAPEVDGVTYIKGAHLEPGQIVKATIEQAGIYDLKGRVVSEPTQ